MKSSVWLLALMFGLVGCSRSVEELNQADEKNPRYESGKQKLMAKDYRGALEDFERALETQPRNAKAHFEAGMLRDGDKIKPNDYAEAIYHYQKFLALRPQSEKAEVVRGFIRDDLMRLAAGVPHSNVAPPQEIARLQGENDALRHENEDLRQRLDQLGHRAPPTAAAAATPAPPASNVTAPSAPVAPTVTAPAVATASPTPRANTNPPPARARRYVVQKGDTLSSIARKTLGTPTAAEKIYAANRTVLRDKNKLSVGQVLTIPAL